MKKNVASDLKKVLVSLIEVLWAEDEQVISGFLKELSKKQTLDFLIYFFLTHKHLDLEAEFSKLKHKIIELLNQNQ